MALIVLDKIISRDYLTPPKDATPFYISVPTLYLKEVYYEIQIGAKILGKILKMVVFGTKDNLIYKEEISELSGKSIEFIFGGTMLVHDKLYISKNSWKILRDYGALAGSHISAKLEKAVIDSEEITIYPKRDVYA